MSRAKVSENNKTIIFGVLLSRFITFFLLRFLPLLKFFGTKSRLQQTGHFWGTSTKICMFFFSSQTDVDHSKQDTTCKLNRLIQQ